MRGTSALEGFHQHIRRFFSGHSTSPRLAQALLMQFVYTWNTRANVRHRGGVDLGHEDLRLMHKIHHMERAVCMDTNSTNTNVGVAGLPDVDAFEDTKERFGFGGLSESLTEQALDTELQDFLVASARVQEQNEEGPRYRDRDGNTHGEGDPHPCEHPHSQHTPM